MGTLLVNLSPIRIPFSPEIYKNSNKNLHLHLTITTILPPGLLLSLRLPPRPEFPVPRHPLLLLLPPCLSLFLSPSLFFFFFLLGGGGGGGGRESAGLHGGGLDGQ